MSILRLVVIISCCALLGGCSAETETSDPPNIVFILADDMGYGDVEAYNSHSQISTPHLNRLIEEGRQFMDAHASASVCIPSRYGLLTGRHPHQERTEEWRERALLDPEQPTLATDLRERGYSTYMVGKWHLGFEGGDEYNCSESLQGGPVDHGFDHYFGIPASLDQPPYFYIRDDRCVQAPTDTTEGNQPGGEIWTDIQGPFWRAGDRAPDFHHDEVLSRFTEETLSYLRTHRTERGQDPFFMYMALAAPHTPWLPSDSVRGASGAGLYGDFVTEVDAAIGKVLDALDQLGLTENTLIVVTSDNGPVWYAKDRRRFKHRSTDVYRGMKADAWEGGHRVPFVTRWPSEVPEKTISDELITFTDMRATLSDIAGTSLSEKATDGYNMRPVLTADQDSIQRDGAVFQGVYYMAVRNGPWKLIPGLGSGGFITTPNTREPEPGEPEGQLYHLGRDPGEQNNLYDERPDVVERLQGRLEHYREQRPE